MIQKQAKSKDVVTQKQIEELDSFYVSSSAKLEYGSRVPNIFDKALELIRNILFNSVGSSSLRDGFFLRFTWNSL